MYTNNKETKIYLFDLCKQCHIAEFSTEQSLLHFLKKHSYKNWRDDYCNHYFDCINMNGNDTKRYISFNGQGDLYLREYLFIDEHNRIIDIRKYKEQIFDELNTQNVQEKENDSFVEYGDVLYLYNCLSFRYRIDPVPYVHCRRYHRGSYYRKTKIMNENKLNSDTDYLKFTRPKRKHLPDFWDEQPRHYEKSWKRQSKKRKQWM